MAAIQPQEKSQPSLQRQVLAELFSTLQLIYGDRFIKAGSNVNDMMSLWSYQLRTTTDSQIKQAAMAVVDQYPTHPPTIGEFRKVIKSLPDGQESRDAGPTICPTCRGHLASQTHADDCGNGRYQP